MSGTGTRAGEAEAVELVRAAMGAGVACALDKARRGEMDLSGSLGDAFGDFPAEFLRIRPQLLDAFAAAVRAEHGEQIAQRIEVERANPRYGYAENVVLTVAARLAREAQS